MIKVLPVVFWGVLLARGRLVAAAARSRAHAGGGHGAPDGRPRAGRRACTAFGEWLAVLREEEGPWGLIASRNSLRENNEALSVVLARTFGDLDPGLTRNAVSLARLPLPAVWGIWIAMLAAMGAVWIACAWRARRAAPERAWLGMFGAHGAASCSPSPTSRGRTTSCGSCPPRCSSRGRPRVLVAVAALGQPA